MKSKTNRDGPGEVPGAEKPDDAEDQTVKEESAAMPAAPPGSPENSTPADDASGAGSDCITQQLRGLYDRLLDEPIPDRFVQLLKQLGDKGGADR